jgi:hypothetical protein
VVRVVLSVAVLALAGCEPLAVSMLGAGAGAALRYNFDGVTYRTFTAPAPAVRQASLSALERMGITLDATAPYEYGEIISARCENRTIQIEVEPISPRATRIRIAARNGGLFYDTATASEIIAQTERLLDSAARGGAGASSASF